MKKERRIRIVTFSLIITAAMFFVWWMSFSNFKVSYQDIKQEYYAVVTEQVVNEIETSVKYGKTLDSFYNIDSVFDEIHSFLSGRFKAIILNSKDEVLYSSTKSDAERKNLVSVLNEPNVSYKIDSSGSGQYIAVSQRGNDIMIFPIHNNSGNIIGKFVLIYPETLGSGDIAAQQRQTMKATLIILGASIALLLLFFMLFRRFGRTDGEAAPEAEFIQKRIRLNKKLLEIIPAAIVILGIMTQSVYMYVQYQQKYKETLIGGAKGIMNYIDTTINTLHSKGVSYDSMSGLDGYLVDKVKESPILWNVQINTTLYDTDDTLHRQNDLIISSKLQNSSGGKATEIQINISQNYLNSKMYSMLLSFLATILISGIIIFEFIRLPDIIAESKEKDKKSGKIKKKLRNTPACLRMATFVMFVGVYVSFPYSANLVRQWGAGLFGLSTDISASLPVTAELLSIMVFSILFSNAFKGRNLRFMLLFSFALIFAGNLFCTVAFTLPFLIFIRMICGAGFAGLKTVINNIVSYGCESSEQRGQNLSSMNAGLLGGITCGGSLGAVISDSIGITWAFFFTAVILAAFAVLTLFMMPWSRLGENIKAAGTREMRQKSGGTYALLAKPAVLRYVLFVTLPLNIGLMFIVSFVPGFIQKLNYPTLLTSYGYLINGMAGIYLGPPLAKAMTQKFGRPACVSVMLLLGAVSMIFCSVSPTIAGVLVATALMGLFDGFGTPVSMDYFIEMPQVKGGANETGALALLSVMGSAVQMVSPMLYGAVMAVSLGYGMNSVVFLAAAFLIFAVLFGATQKRNFRQSRVSE